MSVIQKGGATSGSWRSRSFTYDSLSRLKCAANPEITSTPNTPASCPTVDTGVYTPGTIGYSYDQNGNLIARTSPAPNQSSTSSTVQATYSYDSLNRLVNTAYSDGVTPAVQNGYDGVALVGCATAPPTITDSFPIGRPSSMCDGAGATSWSHDSVGRIIKEKRTNLSGGTPYTNVATYGYALDGSLATVTYPSSGRTITFMPGGAGRALSAQDIANGINYVENAHYAPLGD